MVGVFESEKNNKIEKPDYFDYLWIVNKDYSSTINNAKIHLTGYCVGNIYISQRIDTCNPSADNFSLVTNAYFDKENNQTVVTIPKLTAGEGIMLKIVMKRFIKYRNYDGDGISDRSVKTDQGEWKIDNVANEFISNWEDVYYQYGNASAHAVPADYDGDGRTDLAVKTDDEKWLIDYSNNGFGAWNIGYDQYGGPTVHPVPADYDGDGLADLSVKTDDGEYSWLIDYAKNGFGGWEPPYYKQYGNAIAHAVRADYDGDGRTDLAVKTDDEKWLIDYSNNGFGVWDVVYDQYGGPTAHPVPADYDGDGLADLSVKTDDTRMWLIDFARNGFGRWDLIMNDDRGNSSAHPIPADYDGDGMADLSVKTDDGLWLIDYANNGYVGWEWEGSPLVNNGGVGSVALKQNVMTDSKNNLLQSIPNPFSSSTIIKFNLVEKPKTAEIYIYDGSGKIMDKIILTNKNIEDRFVEYKASSLQPGIFYYFLIANGKISEKIN